MPLGIERQVEYVLNRAGAFVDVPQFGSRTVTFVLRGAVDLSTGYRLELRVPALVHPDQMEVVVRGTDGPIGPLDVLGPSETQVDAPAVSFELRGDALVVAPPESLRTGPNP